MPPKCDFCGWATRNDIRCSDGRIIRKDAFKHNDGMSVPLVWNHQHNEPYNVLGHALLENRNDGVYAYGFLNDNEAGKTARGMLKNGDIHFMSIYANKLQQSGSGEVLHGDIREVSLVLAGANPGAQIEAVMVHSDDFAEGDQEDLFVVNWGDEIDNKLSHSDDQDIESSDSDKVKNAFDALTDEQKNAVYAMISTTMRHSEVKKEEKSLEDENAEMQHNDDVEEEKKMADGGKTVKDVFDTLTEEQKTVVYALIGAALEQAKGEKKEEGEDKMKHNVFEGDAQSPEEVLTHAEMEDIMREARDSNASLRDVVLAHGITNIDYLFPDPKNVTGTPIFVDRDQGWVKKFMNAVHHTPFSRIRSTFADITPNDARAKGWLKTNEGPKAEETFALIKRETPPQTVYKKQSIDRDDVIDITDFDVVAWLKTEMRGKLDEELARAMLVGDGRSVSSADKIKETSIRPIWKDADFYTIKQVVPTGSDAPTTAKNFIRAAVGARKNYKGSGNPTLFCTEDVLTECLLLEDSIGRRLYDSEAILATALRVKEIVAVPVMENQTRTVDSSTHTLMGIIVNPTDYNVGADRGGAVNMFDDFDIDYNKQKYLIETRCSGALTVPYSAIALETVASNG